MTFDAPAESAMQIGDKLFVLLWDGQHFKAYGSEEVIGSGTYGIALAVNELATGKHERVLKFANTEEHLKDKAVKSIVNEFNILSTLNQYGRVQGIQDAPISMIYLTVGDDTKVPGFMISRYDYDLTKPEFKTLEFNIRANACSDLIQGLSHAHQKGYVHGDIKPCNCCSKNEKLQIADWGDAAFIGCEEIDLLNPLGVHSAFYTSTEDELEQCLISGLYQLHLCAQEFDPKPFTIVKSLNYYLLNYNETGANSRALTPEYISQVREYIAFIIKDIDESDLAPYFISHDDYAEEIEKINESTQNARMPDLSPFVMDDDKLQHLKEEARNLAKRHDVYALAITILENLSSFDPTNEQFASLNNDELYEMMLAEINGQVSAIHDLIHTIVMSEANSRPNADEMLRLYDEARANA